MDEIDVINFLIEDKRFENKVKVTRCEISGMYDENNHIDKKLMDELHDTTGRNFYLMKNTKGEGFSIHFERKECE